MIVDNCHSSADSGATESHEVSDPVSKSQRKRDAHAVRELALQICQLGVSERESLPLTDEIRQTIDDYIKLSANGAKKRQLGLLAKCLRNSELEPIEQAIEQLNLSARANTAKHHQVELWRDRLLGNSPNESSAEALTCFLDEFKHADRQQIRQLQRQALKERSTQKPPSAARQLFRTLRDTIDSPAGS
ncbi:MAG: DUF615 domain-containing protein [Granulosicoccus sp.]|nr:DUF615 domain-containing protein [Granulosicoccus sp.]